MSANEGNNKQIIEISSSKTVVVFNKIILWYKRQIFNINDSISIAKIQAKIIAEKVEKQITDI